MQCSRCGLQLSLDDNFCRHCGAATEIIDVPAVRREARAVSVWKGAKPAVARGVALIAAGAMLRYVAAWAGKAMLSRTLADDPTSLRHLVPFGREPAGERGGEELEILWYRRVRR